MTTPMILDCDTGVDDTLAILYAALSPDIELLGVGSVWGNVDVPQATRNTSHTLALVGRDDVPVAPGAAGPINGGEPWYAYYVHGEDGQGNRYSGLPVPPPVPTTAAQQIVDVCRSRPGAVEVVAVGPLTNLALALGLEPELPRLVRGVTIMGGAALHPGNATPAAEANIHHDPEAAQAVFAADWPLTMVGLDVTMRTLLDESHRERLTAGGTVGAYVAGILEFYMDFFSGNDFDERRSCMHDALAVAIAAGHVDVTLAPVVHAEVVTDHGPARGQTLCDLRGLHQGFPAQEGARCRVVLECDTSFGDEVVRVIADAGDSPLDLRAALARGAVAEQTQPEAEAEAEAADQGQGQGQGQGTGTDAGAARREAVGRAEGRGA